MREIDWTYETGKAMNDKKTAEAALWWDRRLGLLHDVRRGFLAGVHHAHHSVLHWKTDADDAVFASFLRGCVGVRLLRCHVQEPLEPPSRCSVWILRGGGRNAALDTQGQLEVTQIAGRVAWRHMRRRGKRYRPRSLGQRARR